LAPLSLVWRTHDAADKAKQDTDTTLGATKDGIDKVLDATKEVASATGEAITDGWVTAKVSAKFADDPAEGDNINGC
jgi:hypothetical protein